MLEWNGWFVWMMAGGSANQNRALNGSSGSGKRQSINEINWWSVSWSSHKRSAACFLFFSSCSINFLFINPQTKEWVGLCWLIEEKFSFLWIGWLWAGGPSTAAGNPTQLSMNWVVFLPCFLPIHEEKKRDWIWFINERELNDEWRDWLMRESWSGNS